MITVSRRARHRVDRAGDPLDGLVNLFDLGIVLAVAFLLAALSSMDLTDALTGDGQAAPSPDSITLKPGEVAKDVPAGGARTAGEGEEVGTVYRLKDGRLIYVTGSTGSVP